jgi:16S rRNA (cytidine1402-2'-O)-methyltransferase
MRVTGWPAMKDGVKPGRVMRWGAAGGAGAAIVGAAGARGRPPAQAASPAMSPIAMALRASAQAVGARDVRDGAKVDKMPRAMSTPGLKGADPTGRRGKRPSRAAAGAGDQKLEPGLYVVATPIGNLRDITLRALDVLKGADVVFAEDTRVTRKLLSAYGISARVEAYHEHNAPIAAKRVLAALAEGQAVALTSDAGTPLISDPGQPLVRAAAAAGHRIIPIPGASAALAALSASGLPTDRFLFAGFPPTRSKARRAWLADLAAAPATLVLFETGPRLAESLADMAAVFGDRDAVVCRELTKVYEEFRRGPLRTLAAAAALGEPPKGEMVVLIGPPAPAGTLSESAIEKGEADAALRAALARMTVKDAAHVVAEALGAPRRALYRRALALKGEP